MRHVKSAPAGPSSAAHDDSFEKIISKVKKVASLEHTERAMGLTPARHEDLASQDGTTTWARCAARQLVVSPCFECFVQAAILANAVQVGIQTDDMAARADLGVPAGHMVAGLCFCLIFTAELALRLFVHRRRFFTMWGYGWNVFDLLLVLVQLTEESLAAVEALGGDSPTDAKGLHKNALLRMSRLLRVVKILRVIRLMRYFEDLRLLVSCILHSVKPFFWAASLIGLIIYVVGIYLTHIVFIQRMDDGLGRETHPELMDYYGSVPRSVLCLFQALTGGVDWRDVMAPLLEYAALRWTAALLLVYMAFSLLGIMNVVTGTFVQSAIERAEEVKELNRVSQARKLFKCLDLDASGYISFEEIHDHLHTPAVQEFMRSIDVDVSEARCLFEVMDMSGSGSIDFDEFLSACLRLQGPARALDLILLTRDSRRFFEQHSALLYHLASLLDAPRGAEAEAAAETGAEGAAPRGPPKPPTPKALFFKKPLPRGGRDNNELSC